MTRGSGRIFVLDMLAATHARVFGAEHPLTLATIARWRAAAGYQPRIGASDAELRAWNREAGEPGNGNRHARAIRHHRPEAP